MESKTKRILCWIKLCSFTRTLGKALSIKPTSASLNDWLALLHFQPSTGSRSTPIRQYCTMSLSPTEWVCMRACVIPVAVREIKEGCCKNLSVSCIFRAHTTHQRRHRGQNAVFQGKQTFVARPTTVSFYPCFSKVFLKAYVLPHLLFSGRLSLVSCKNSSCQIRVPFLLVRLRDAVHNFQTFMVSTHDLSAACDNINRLRLVINLMVPWCERYMISDCDKR